MPWIQISFQTDKTHAEPAEELLWALEALSVTMLDAEDDPVLEPKPGETPIWNQNVFQALFERDRDGAEIITFLSQELSLNSDVFHCELIEDKDWERECMDQFKPMQFGQNLWIVPSWLEAPDPDAANILLDPGLAFGTGTHPTTDLCLQWLDANPPKGESLIDYGCGSGILAIAALKLGANSVQGVDIDPQALEASRSNALNNQIADVAFPLFYPENFNLKQPVNLLLANILSGPLVELALVLSPMVAAGGKIVLSGILAEQSEAVRAAYAPWFTMSQPTQKEDWIRLEGTKL